MTHFVNWIIVKFLAQRHHLSASNHEGRMGNFTFATLASLPKVDKPISKISERIMSELSAYLALISTIVT